MLPATSGHIPLSPARWSKQTDSKEEDSHSANPKDRKRKKFHCKEIYTLYRRAYGVGGRSRPSLPPTWAIVLLIHLQENLCPTHLPGSLWECLASATFLHSGTSMRNFNWGRTCPEKRQWHHRYVPSPPRTCPACGSSGVMYDFPVKTPNHQKGIVFLPTLFTAWQGCLGVSQEALLHLVGASSLCSSRKHVGPAALLVPGHCRHLPSQQGSSFAIRAARRGTETPPGYDRN